MKSLVSLLNVISTFRGYLMLKRSLYKNLGGSYFFKDNNPKVNVIARLELEHASIDVAVKHIFHYATGNTIVITSNHTTVL